MKRLSSDVIEFQPDAIQIKNERMPFWLRYSVFTIFLFFAGVITWSILCKVDVIVQAPGKLVTNKPQVVMKPLERSVIKEVNVVIGQHVKPGDVLITFDPTINLAEADRLKNDINVYQAQNDRLKAEFDGVDYVIPEEATENQKEQLIIFQKRQALYQERIRGFDESLREIKATHTRVTGSMEKEEERLKTVQEIEDINQSLVAGKNVTRQEILQIQMTRIQIEEAVDQYRNQLDELVYEGRSKVAEKNTFEQQWHNDIAEEYVKIRQQLDTVRHDYEKIQQLIEYIYLRSPCEAVVHEIAGFSPGSAVREAETLITLIPLDGNLEMEAELRPQDIGKVRAGSQVRVKISAFPFQKYGTLDNCVVRDISSDTIERQQMPGANNSPNYYRARITLNGRLRNQAGKIVNGLFEADELTGQEENASNSENNPEDHSLIPGMEAVAEIKTDKRRIIEYLVYPLIKAFDETAREP